jgi:transmembrane sensor
VVMGTFALMGTMPWLYFGDARLTNVPKDTSTTYKTTTGVIREVKLPDNSLVKLNTRSQITVTYALHARNVNLDYGEASFDVVRNPDRPFNVRAGKREFQADGTRFIVRVIDPDNVELTVTEGEVKVVYAPPRLPQTPEEKRANLTFGEQTLTALQTARVQPGYQSVRELITGEKEAREAWLDGKIIFDRTPLADALAEVDRYTNIEFIVADEKLRNVRVAGDFRAGDIEGLLDVLRKNFQIDSRRDAHGRVVLTALTGAGS